MNRIIHHATGTVTAIIVSVFSISISLAANAMGPSTPLKDQMIQYTGTAYSLIDEQVLYREEHTLTIENGQPAERMTLYYDAENNLFAEKNNRYRAHPATPDFILTDDRYGYRESMEKNGQGWRVEYKEPNESGQDTLSKPDYTPVIDAGFDEFVRASWGALLKGNTVNFSFAVPSRLEWINFRLIPLKQKDGLLTVEMRLKSRLISWLLEPVSLSYDIQSQRLMTYRGLTNIRRSDGEGIKAEIRYRYPQLN